MIIHKITKLNSFQNIFWNTLIYGILSSSLIAYFYIVQASEAAQGAIVSNSIIIKVIAPIVVFVGLAYIFYNILVFINVKSRDKKFLSLKYDSSQYGIELQPLSADKNLTSLNNFPGIRNAKFKNLISNKDWTYADYSYEIFRETKSGDYKAATVFYSFIMTKLPRSLPNIVFDSLASRKRQFKRIFDRSQLQSLEGNFDNFYATYFPKFYSIDSLAFITPEVMEAMVAAMDYDIEICGDTLFLYGDLQDPSLQIPDMASKILSIKEKLMHNIVTYRDERLPFDEGREKVTPYAVALRGNLNQYYFVMFGGIALLITTFIVSILYHKQKPLAYAAGTIIFLFGFVSLILEKKKRRNIDRSMANAARSRHEA